jgi:hypothetical protein
MQRWAVLVMLTGCSETFWDLSKKRNPYAVASGYETFDYRYGAADGDLDCHLVWAVLGEKTPIPNTCVGCEFVFDVRLLYEAGPYKGQSIDPDGLCADLANDQLDYKYAYSRRYGTLMISYGEVYYLQWLDAEWTESDDGESGVLVYGGGVRDVDLSSYGDVYAGYYYTYYWYGRLNVFK